MRDVFGGLFDGPAAVALISAAALAAMFCQPVSFAHAQDTQQDTQTAAQKSDKPPLTLRDMGSFHVGGRLVEIKDRPPQPLKAPVGPGQVTSIDINGTYLVEAMYVQYFLPQDRKGKLPLLLWHGGGLTGVTYETTPDGREGWLNIFLRKGWDTYVSDAVERGRAGFAMSEIYQSDPLFTTMSQPWEGYRIGAGEGSWDPDPAKRKVGPGGQFPVESYDNLMKQIVPRWTTTNDAIIAAYVALVDKICPCAIIAHSQAGNLSYQVALKRPDKIKAIVAIESTLRGTPETVKTLKDVPILALSGDNLDKSPSFSSQHANNVKVAAMAKEINAKFDLVDLPDLGIKGNDHFVMMDKNSADVAEVIQTWLAKQGLYDAP